MKVLQIILFVLVFFAGQALFNKLFGEDKVVSRFELRFVNSSIVKPDEQRIIGYCDTSNGTMVYIGPTGNIAVVPKGCQ